MLHKKVIHVDKGKMMLHKKIILCSKKLLFFLERRAIISYDHKWKIVLCKEELYV